MESKAQRNLAHSGGAPGSAFFLFGPRGTGKSTWIRTTLPDALVVNLLPADAMLGYEFEQYRSEFGKGLSSLRRQSMKADSYVVYLGDRELTVDGRHPG